MGECGACGRGRESLFITELFLVGECGAADGAEVIEMDDQAAIGGDGVEVGDFGEGAAFARVSALAVTGVEKGDAVLAVTRDGFGSADAGIHAAGEEDDGGGFGSG